MQQQTEFSFDVRVRDLPDITRRKHKGHRNSEEANAKVEETKAPMRERVRIYVAGCEWMGATVHEICKQFGKLPHQISGRISELKQDKKVFDSGRDRGGASVLVARTQWVNEGFKG
jgi:hypothetical protein